ncbi:MAG TPA: UV DNA damage repair endonuclease UvsE [Candidatus Polarisedimenticolaceae bacterium]|nr:UV DNA damage repair endonuclease UvsE [Candidatus Polarisedimenticolaceae bacterium]
MIRLGYACINTKLDAPNRTCRLKNATPEKILELASANVEALQSILEWNAARGIELFRITSDLIPFGSHPINTVPWWQILKSQFASLGEFIANKRLRVSMHPGQFTILNSPRHEVVANSVKELEYHTAVLDALGVDNSHKIVIHLGGVYEDKRKSLGRFVENCKKLDSRIRARLVIENDERCYTVADALKASKAIGVPVVFDVFHHVWNPALESLPVRSIIRLAAKTWRKRDGRVKIHYSNQWPGGPAGAHSKSINVGKFLQFYDTIHDLDVDIMLEVKDKQQSVLKLSQALCARQIRAA